MDFLIDTHTFLWFISDDPKLSPTAKSLIEHADNTPILSIASIWEMSIKVSLGKLSIPEPPIRFIENELTINRITTLPIEIQHLEHVIALPFHHRDPFDRLMIAQAMSRDLRIVSIDGAFDAYPIQRLW